MLLQDEAHTGVLGRKRNARCGETTQSCSRPFEGLGSPFVKTSALHKVEIFFRKFLIPYHIAVSQCSGEDVVDYYQEIDRHVDTYDTK